MLRSARIFLTHGELVRVFTQSTLNKSTERTKLGVVWWVADPLLMTAVYVLLVELLRGGGPAPAYPLFVMTGLVAWKATASSLSTSTTKIVSSEMLIKNYRFPSIVLPISVVLANFSLFLVALPLVIVLALFYQHVLGHDGVAVGLWLLFLPLVVGLHVLATAGLAFALTCLGVFVIDVSKLVGHVMRVGWYLSAGLYSLDWAIPGYAGLLQLDALTPRHVLLLNPAVYLLEAYRDVTIYNRAPDLVGLGLFALVAVAVLVVGDRVYHRYEHLFAKVI